MGHDVSETETPAISPPHRASKLAKKVRCGLCCCWSTRIAKRVRTNAGLCLCCNVLATWREYTVIAKQMS